jgi:hypothetical protein
MTSEAREDPAELDMLVIQFGDRTVKGYAERSQWEDLNTRESAPVFRRVGSKTTEEIPLDGIKAIFFVKSFEGKSHEDLRFHDHLPAPECLWVRATFDDGEVIEGLIANDAIHVIHEGFYMSPIDPEGNNWLIYIVKNKLKDFQILGLRAAPKTMRGLSVTRPATADELTPQTS